MKKVSIIIPTRNRWTLLRDRALRSINRQTYKNWEIIIVDDGSDNPPTYEFNKSNPKIKFYHIDKVYTYPKDNKKAEWLAGPVNALNFALSKVNSDSDYIARLDDDDFWHPDMLETMVDFIQSDDYDFVSSLWQDENDLIGMPEVFIKNFIGGVQTWLYKSEYKDIKYDPECWKKSWMANNEWDWYERFSSIPGIKIGFLPKVVCIIKPRPGLKNIGLKGYMEEHNDR